MRASGSAAAVNKNHCTARRRRNQELSWVVQQWLFIRGGKVNRHDLDMIRVWKCKLTVNWPCYVFKKSQNCYYPRQAALAASAQRRAISRRMAEHGCCENQLNWTQITWKFESGVKCKNIFRRTLTRISISEWVLAARNRTGIDKYLLSMCRRIFHFVVHFFYVVTSAGALLHCHNTYFMLRGNWFW